jgi:hypothetical protein
MYNTWMATTNILLTFFGYNNKPHICPILFFFCFFTLQTKNEENAIET